MSPDYRNAAGAAGELRQQFTYNIGGNGLVIPAAGGANFTLSLEGGSHFRLEKSTGYALSTNPQLTTVQIRDSMTNSNWFFQPMPCLHLFGQPGWPFIWPHKPVYPQRVVITLTFQDIGAAGDTIWMEFHGYKIKVVDD